MSTGRTSTGSSGAAVRSNNDSFSVTVLQADPRTLDAGTDGSVGGAAVNAATRPPIMLECAQLEIPEKPLRYLLLDEGLFWIRVVNKSHFPTIAKLEVDGLLMKSNFRLPAFGAHTIKSTRGGSGMPAVPLAFKPSLAQHEPFSSVEEIDGQCGVLRLLFFEVADATAAKWELRTREPFGVVMLRYGYAPVFRHFFSLDAGATRQLSPELAEVAGLQPRLAGEAVRGGGEGRISLEEREAMDEEYRHDLDVIGVEDSGNAGGANRQSSFSRAPGSSSPPSRRIVIFDSPKPHAQESETEKTVFSEAEVVPEQQEQEELPSTTREPVTGRSPPHEEGRASARSNAVEYRTVNGVKKPFALRSRYLDVFDHHRPPSTGRAAVHISALAPPTSDDDQPRLRPTRGSRSSSTGAASRPRSSSAGGKAGENETDGNPQRSISGGGVKQRPAGTKGRTPSPRQGSESSQKEIFRLRNEILQWKSKYEELEGQYRRDMAAARKAEKAAAAAAATKERQRLIQSSRQQQQSLSGSGSSRPTSPSYMGGTAGQRSHLYSGGGAGATSRQRSSSAGKRPVSAPFRVTSRPNSTERAAPPASRRGGIPPRSDALAIQQQQLPQKEVPETVVESTTPLSQEEIIARATEMVYGAGSTKNHSSTALTSTTSASQQQELQLKATAGGYVDPWQTAAEGMVFKAPPTNPFANLRRHDDGVKQEGGQPSFLVGANPSSRLQTPEIPSAAEGNVRAATEAGPGSPEVSTTHGINRTPLRPLLHTSSGSGSVAPPAQVAVTTPPSNQQQHHPLSSGHVNHYGSQQRGPSPVLFQGSASKSSLNREFLTQYEQATTPSHAILPKVTHENPEPSQILHEPGGPSGSGRSPVQRKGSNARSSLAPSS